MDLKLNPKHEKLTEKVNQYSKSNEEMKTFFKHVKESSKAKSGKYDSTRDKYICDAYEGGLPVSTIAKNAKVSMGLFYTTLRKYGIEERSFNKNKVYKSVKHITDDSEKLKSFINDYSLLSMDEIYWKYKIHKNGVYYILDMLDIPRKKGDLIG